MVHVFCCPLLLCSLGRITSRKLTAHSLLTACCIPIFSNFRKFLDLTLAIYVGYHIAQVSFAYTQCVQHDKTWITWVRSLTPWPRLLMAKCHHKYQPRVRCRAGQRPARPGQHTCSKCLPSISQSGRHRTDDVTGTSPPRTDVPSMKGRRAISCTADGCSCCNATFIIHLQLIGYDSER